MPADYPVLIAGAGIAGLATALALAAKGIPARLLERRDAFSEAGAGIQLGPNGMRILADLGAAAALDATVGRPEVLTVRAGSTRAVIAELPLGRWIAQRHGAPYCVAHRADLQAALVGAVAARGIPVELGFEVTSITQTDAGVAVADQHGRALTGRALVAADGVFSNIRTRVAPGAAAVFSGKHAMRTVLPAHGLPIEFSARATGVWLSPDAHVVHYPIRAGNELAIVVITDEPGADLGWSRVIAGDQVLRRLRSFAPRLRDTLGRAEAWRAWSLYTCPPLPNIAAGRIALAGDAAHPTLPFLAQGGVMALEDAVTLAHKLSRQPDAPEQAFAAYERRRLIRVTRVQEVSRRNGQIYHLSGLSAAARNATLRAVPGTVLMSALDWLYGWTLAADGTQ